MPIFRSSGSTRRMCGPPLQGGSFHFKGAASPTWAWSSSSLGRTEPPPQSPSSARRGGREEPLCCLCLAPPGVSLPLGVLLAPLEVLLAPLVILHGEVEAADHLLETLHLRFQGGDTGWHMFRDACHRGWCGLALVTRCGTVTLVHRPRLEHAEQLCGVDGVVAVLPARRGH